MTRATDVLRLPVPWYVAFSAKSVSLLSGRAERLRVLGGVRVVRPGVQLQLAQLRARDAVARHHPADRVSDDLLGARLEHLRERALLEPPVVATVAVVDLVGQLLAGDPDPGAVHHDHEVAGVDVRRVLRLSLAPQGVGDLRGQTAERLAVRIDDEPAALDLSGLRVVGLGGHENSRLFLSRYGHAQKRPAQR